MIDVDDDDLDPAARDEVERRVGAGLDHLQPVVARPERAALVDVVAGEHDLDRALSGVHDLAELLAAAVEALLPGAKERGRYLRGARRLDPRAQGAALRPAEGRRARDREDELRRGSAAGGEDDVDGRADVRD